MAEAMQGLVSETKKNKFSTVAKQLTDDDVLQIWGTVSEFIEKQMSTLKGVHIPALGTFTFTQQKLDVGNNKFILMQRPVFLLSEKFSKNYGINSAKYHTDGQVPIVPLNFAAIAYECPFSRDLVESCIKEVLQALARSVTAKRKIEFIFKGIGRLQFRDAKVKMKFYKDFINSMDGTGRLVDAMQDRPGTVDSVMSDRSTSFRPGSTLILPRISSGGLALGPADNAMPTISEEAAPSERIAGAGEPHVDQLILSDRDDHDAHPYEYDIGRRSEDLFEEEGRLLNESRTSPTLHRHQQGSRMAVTIAKANGINFDEDLLPNMPKSTHDSPTSRQPLTPIRPHSAATQLNAMRMDTDQPPASACGHKNAGQELCYLCHQRERRNIPISFTEDRKQREQEEDRLLQQFQHMNDRSAMMQEQDKELMKRHESQKMAAFNLGVSDAVNEKKLGRSMDFHPSYVFQKRPLTPPRFVRQEQYHTDLLDQVRSKEDSLKRRKADDQFLERLEQVQLAEDLAARREQFLKAKNEQKEQYKRALSAQIRFRPAPMPPQGPDMSDVLFGKSDMKNDVLAERRRQAHDLYKEQVQTVEQRKREAILRRLTDQRDEEKMLQRTKNEFLDDRACRYERMFRSRKLLEEDWSRSREMKKGKDLEQKHHDQLPGALLHEQCDKYHRCGQCKRHVNNYGESNIWRDTRYIPGSRIVV